MQKILVTGGTGFLGRNLVPVLIREGFDVVVVGKADGDLLFIDGAKYLLEQTQPDIIIHAAGFNGNIEMNMSKHAEIFYQNTIMALNLYKAAEDCESVKEIYPILASCAYSDKSMFFLETDYILAGAPDPTVYGHGYAKRNLYLASQFSTKKSYPVCITTMYGPNDPGFDIPGKSKVLNTLIGRFVTAKLTGRPYIKILGTGKAARQFIYIDDAVEYLAEYINAEKTDTINIKHIATDTDIPIYDLVQILTRVIGYKGEVLWDNDSSKDGVLAKKLESCYYRLKSGCGPSSDPYYSGFTKLEEGIQKTAAWYEEKLRG